MARTDGALLRGTFEMMILKALSLGAIHGWGVVERIEQLTGGAFAIQQGVVYPALQRLLRQGFVTSEWRASDNNRRARFYRLTALGRRQLADETESWTRLVSAIGRLMRAQAEGA